MHNVRMAFSSLKNKMAFHDAGSLRLEDRIVKPFEIPRRVSCGFHPAPDHQRELCIGKYHICHYYMGSKV
jgi:hypothetical protein